MTTLAKRYGFGSTGESEDVQSGQQRANGLILDMELEMSKNPDDDYTCDECGGHGGDHDEDCDSADIEI